MWQVDKTADRYRQAAHNGTTRQHGIFIRVVCEAESRDLNWVHPQLVCGGPSSLLLEKCEGREANVCEPTARQWQRLEAGERWAWYISVILDLEK